MELQTFLLTPCTSATPGCFPVVCVEFFQIEKFEGVSPDVTNRVVPVQ